MKPALLQCRQGRCARRAWQWGQVGPPAPQTGGDGAATPWPRFTAHTRHTPRSRRPSAPQGPHGRGPLPACEAEALVRGAAGPANRPCVGRLAACGGGCGPAWGARPHPARSPVSHAPHYARCPAVAGPRGAPAAGPRALLPLHAGRGTACAAGALRPPPPLAGPCSSHGLGAAHTPGAHGAGRPPDRRAAETRRRRGGCWELA